MHLLAERFVFWGGDDQGFLKEGFKTYLTAPMSPINSTFFVSLHPFSIWGTHECEKSVVKESLPYYTTVSRAS